MCDIDLEPCEAWSETSRRARKLHECDCCGGDIHPGETYVAHFSKFEGEVFFEKQCAACEATVIVFAKEHGQRSRPGYNHELIVSCIGDGDDDSARWQSHVDEMRLRAEARERRLAEAAP